MLVPIGSAVIVAWDANVGGIEHATNTETGVVYAHTEDDHHMIHLDDPSLRKYARLRWPLCEDERGRTWDHLIVIDGDVDVDNDDVWNATGVPLPSSSQQMNFVLNRPPSRGAAVRAMHAISCT